MIREGDVLLKKSIILIVFLFMSTTVSLSAETIDRLILNLGSSDDTLSQYAVWRLVDIGSQAVDPLIKALNSDNKDLRIRSAMVLGMVGDRKAFQPLIDLLKDRKSVV